MCGSSAKFRSASPDARWRTTLLAEAAEGPLAWRKLGMRAAGRSSWGPEPVMHRSDAATEPDFHTAPGCGRSDRLSFRPSVGLATERQLEDRQRDAEALLDVLQQSPLLPPCERSAPDRDQEVIRSEVPDCVFQSLEWFVTSDHALGVYVEFLKLPEHGVKPLVGLQSRPVGYRR